MPENQETQPKLDYKRSAMANVLGLDGIELKTFDKWLLNAPKMEEESDEDEDMARNPNAMAEENQVTVYGMIIDEDTADMYRFFGLKSFVTPTMIKEQLKKCEGDIDMMINSPGGSTFAMAEIVNALDNYEGGKITAKITALAASAATIVMLSADEIEIAEMAEIMIHRPRAGFYGKSDEFLSIGNSLKNKEEMVADKYAKKAGKKPKEMLALMDKETWMSSREAIEMGLADRQMAKKRDKETDADMAVVNTEEIEAVALASTNRARNMLLQLTA